MESSTDSYVKLQKKIIALIAAKQFTAAMSLIERNFRAYPNNNWLIRHYGAVLSSLGREKEAIAWLDKALKIKPDDHDCMRERGRALVGLGQRKEAIAWLDKALDIKPDDYDSMRERGRALSGLGQRKEAIAWLDKALDIKPDDPDSIRERGRALSGLGRKKGATAWAASKPREYPIGSSELVTCLGVISGATICIFQVITVMEFFYLHLGLGNNFFVYLVVIVLVVLPTLVSILFTMMSLRSGDLKGVLDILSRRWSLIVLLWVIIGAALVVIASVETQAGSVGQAFLLCGWSFAFLIVLIREFIRSTQKNIHEYKFKTCRNYWNIAAQIQETRVSRWIKNHIVAVEKLIVVFSIISILYIGWGSFSPQLISGKVSQVISGDTLIIEEVDGSKTEIHLFGIYAGSNQLATRALTRMVAGQDVTVQRIKHWYRRGTVGIVKINSRNRHHGTDVGLKLLKNGFVILRNNDFVETYSRAAGAGVVGGKEVHGKYIGASVGAKGYN